MNSLSIVTLNIEGSRHLDLVEQFLKRADADVVCLQEVMETDIPRLITVTAARDYVFAPIAIMQFSGMNGVQGPAIFSKHQFIKKSTQYYIGDGLHIVEFDSTSYQAKQASAQNSVSSVVISCEGIEYQIANTHFPVSEEGQADEFQRTHVPKMLGIIKQLGECVFTGDFNAPRGGEIFASIASQLTDNIPVDIATSIDGSLHRAGPLPYMVDGIFSTPGYQISEVVQHFGISDHSAFTARVTRV